MRLTTKATLAALIQAQWFTSIGVHDTDSAIVLSSWGEAIESCSSPEWEDLCLEAANQYRERLLERSVERFRKWNDVVDKMKPIAQALVREKCQQVVEENDLPQVFLDTVDWDILGVLMEAEYSDVYPLGYYGSQGYWYVHGHFPCGWQGEFPEGKLIIY